MITTEDITLIDRFINEELEPLELRRFQKRVHDDFEFSHEVREHIAAVRNIRSFTALQFMQDVKTAYPTWKKDGYNNYSRSIDLTKIVLGIVILALILGVSFGIYTIVNVDPPTPEPQTIDVQNSSQSELDSPVVDDSVRSKELY